MAERSFHAKKILTPNKMEGSRTKLTDVNPHLVCVLCHGYFVDATTIAECLHSFCRSCIFRQLERKSICPICEVQVHNTKLHLSLRLDKTLQDIVYKLVPGLFRNEMQRRRDFYKNYPYRDEHLDPESRGVGLDRLIYSPDDLISLSLEFYDEELEREEWSSNNNNNNSPKPKPEKEVAPGTKRYLQCPAGFKMAHLKKFIRQKYGLPPNCNVEIMYRRESLPDSYSLMDIAYIYTWKRNGPMRFYYRMPDFVQKQILLPLEEKTEEQKVSEIPKNGIETSKVEATPMKNGDISLPKLPNGKEEAMDIPMDEKAKNTSVPKEDKPEVQVPEKPPTVLPQTNGGVKIDDKSKEVPKIEDVKNASKQKEESTLGNGMVAPRPLSKQDELSVSVLLSLGKCRVDEKQATNEKPDEKTETDDFVFPKPFSYNKAPSTPRPGTEYYNKKILNGKLNPKFSVNNIASALAKNNRLNAGKKILPWQRPDPIKKTEFYIKPKPDKTDPFAFQDQKSHFNTSPVQYKPIAQKTPEPTVPPLKINLSKGNPRVDPSSLPTALPKPKMPHSPSSSQNGYAVNPERPEVTVKTTNGSLTITTQPPIAQNGANSPKQNDSQRKSPNLQKKVNGVSIVPEMPKENGMPMSHKLPPFPKPPAPRKNFMPGGVISKTGPTLDQRIQQLYKNQNNRLPTPTSPVIQNQPPQAKPQESRLANWLNNRFPPQQKPTEVPKTDKSPPKEDKPKESDVAKLSKEMCMLKRKLDELRKAQNACEITHENPIPELEKKRRDVTPDVSIEFMRAADMKKVDKTKEKVPVKRPVPGLKSIQEIDVSKRKNSDEDKGSVKKPKITKKEEDSALDLSGSGATKPAVDLAHRMALIHQNGRLPPPDLHWMMNRPLLANQHFIPRST